MLEFFQFAMSSFWTFLGTVFIIWVLGDAGSKLIRSFRGEDI